MRLPLTALTAGLALALIAPSGAAAIAPKKPFQLRTGTAKTNGTTAAKGTVQFTSTSQASIRGTIDDVCPRDGYGAYLRLKFIYRDGPSSETVATDTRMCEPGPQPFSVLSTYQPGRRIVRVQLILEERNIDAYPTAYGDIAQMSVLRG
jgi:hypothetical protein